MTKACCAHNRLQLCMRSIHISNIKTSNVTTPMNQGWSHNGKSKLVHHGALPLSSNTSPAGQKTNHRNPRVIVTVHFHTQCNPWHSQTQMLGLRLPDNTPVRVGAAGNGLRDWSAMELLGPCSPQGRGSVSAPVHVERLVPLRSHPLGYSGAFQRDQVAATQIVHFFGPAHVPPPVVAQN